MATRSMSAPAKHNEKMNQQQQQQQQTNSKWRTGLDSGALVRELLDDGGGRVLGGEHCELDHHHVAQVVVDSLCGGEGMGGEAMGMGTGTEE